MRSQSFIQINDGQVQHFKDDDCFFSEISNWVDEIEKNDDHVKTNALDTTILSTYEDAVRS